MKHLLSIIFLIALIGCGVKSEVNSASLFMDQERVWVFAQFNVQEETEGLESYYYYAQVSKKLYEAISVNEIESGFILLRNVKYWGNQDLVYEYKDIENQGDIVFRIEDIVKVNVVNVEPIAGRGYEQFELPNEEISTDVQENVNQPGA